MADNRVVIKINYDKDKRRKELIDPKMITVWHTGRIFGALAILVLLIIPILLWLSGEKTGENNPAPNENNNQLSENSSQVKEPATPVSKPLSLQSDSPSPLAVSNKPPKTVILDRRVIRASLGAKPQHDEPGEPIETAPAIAPGQFRELFYFSEIKNMKGRILFHHWLKNERLAYKKTFHVKADKSKLISSKKFGHEDAGEWRAVLIDSHGKSFSEVKFSVNP